MPMVMVEVEPLGFGLLGWRLLQTPPGVPGQPMLPFALVKINTPGAPHDRDPLRCNGGAGLVNCKSSTECDRHPSGFHFCSPQHHCNLVGVVDANRFSSGPSLHNLLFHLTIQHKVTYGSTLKQKRQAKTRSYKVLCRQAPLHPNRYDFTC